MCALGKIACRNVHIQRNEQEMYINFCKEMDQTEHKVRTMGEDLKRTDLSIPNTEIT